MIRAGFLFAAIASILWLNKYDANVI